MKKFIAFIVKISLIQVCAIIFLYVYENKKLQANEVNKQGQVVCTSDPIYGVKEVLQATASSHAGFYDYLGYEECNSQNNYLESQISNSPFTNMAMIKIDQLSPVCTFMSMNHDIGGRYMKTCSDNPEFTKTKACNSANYHRFVHNHIAKAASCFKMDPKNLFSMFTTESFLQVNIMAKGGSARGIGQLLRAHDDLNSNSEVRSPGLNSQYQQYINYYQKNNAGKGCDEYYNELANLPLLKKNDKTCGGLNIDQRVKQDIFYIVAYQQMNISTALRKLAGSGFKMEGEFKDFKNKYALTDTNPFDYMREFRKKNDDAFDKAELLSQKIPPSLNKINNLKKENFSDLNSEYCDSQNVFCTYQKHQAVRENCDTAFDFPDPNNPNEYNSWEGYRDNLADLKMQISKCESFKYYMYLDIYHSMEPESEVRKIFDEMSLYGHNKGTSVQNVFVDYVKKNPELSYNKFTGAGAGSFRQHIVENYKSNTQATNFIFNDPSGAVTGNKSSISKNMRDVVKKGITNLLNKDNKLLSSDGNAQQNQSSQKELLTRHQRLELEQLSNKEGFADRCSSYQ